MVATDCRHDLRPARWPVQPPVWRPRINRFVLALHFSTIPSGRYPGDGGEGRRRGLLSCFGGGRRLGPDGIFSSLSRVLYVNSEGRVVISYLPVVFYVIPVVG